MQRRIVALFVIFIVTSQFCFSETISPPSQPQSGPGSREYKHAAVSKNRYGQGSDEYWLYEPDAPKPASAPVTVFLHGWGATNPAIYGSWIDHLCKRGNVVIYPRYQSDLKASLSDFTPNAIRAIQNGIQRLQSEPGHVRVDLNKFAVVGHSVGGLLAANVAALAAESKLPQVLAVMSIQPGRTWNPISRANVPLSDLAKIPEKTLLLALVGDTDSLARDTDAIRIYKESTKISVADKDFVKFVSDAHGRPELKANHFAPTAPNKNYDNGENLEMSKQEKAIREKLEEKARERMNKQDSLQDEASEPLPSLTDTKTTSFAVNALDFYGTWKLFDALCDSAFNGKNREYALGNTPQQRFMGVWSDGVAVKELIVTDQP